MYVHHLVVPYLEHGVGVVDDCGDDKRLVKHRVIRRLDAKIEQKDKRK